MAITYTLEENKAVVVDSDYPNDVHHFNRKGNNDQVLLNRCRRGLQKHFAAQNIITHTNNMRDDVYMNGTLGRSDYSIGSTQGQAIKTKLEADWADEVSDYESNSLNLVSEYGADREPYVNDSISWYCFDTMPSTVVSDFGLSSNSDHFREWWGLKFDKVTKAVLCKAVYNWSGFLANKRDDMVIPYLPDWLWNSDIEHPVDYNDGDVNLYAAMIHDKDENIDEHYDIYFQAPQNLVKEFCDANSISFTHNGDITDNIMQYGFTVKGTTGEIKYVKTYTRYFIS